MSDGLMLMLAEAVIIAFCIGGVVGYLLAQLTR